VSGKEVAKEEETGKNMGNRKRNEGILKKKNTGQGEKEIRLEIKEEGRKRKKERKESVFEYSLMYLIRRWKGFACLICCVRA
jgi:hypothetical protein